MSFKTYTGYKDSGVDWLEKIPEHWAVRALKHQFKIVGGSTPKSDQDKFWDGDIIWITPADLSKLLSLFISQSQRKITSDGLASCGTTLVPKNSIILSTRAPIGSLAITETELCTNQGCKSLVPFKETNSKYFGYLICISSSELNARGKGTTFLELSGDELGFFKIPVPSTYEQQIIASFLDRETCRIDTLIEEKNRFIELLKEKRLALINHAVTKGLDPTVKMKDSGIEWLGEVPMHWKTPKLLHLTTKIGDGLHGTPQYVESSEIFFINGNNLINGYISIADSTKRISQDEYEKNLLPLDNATLLMSINGTIGSLAFYRGEAVMLGKSAAYINCSNKIHRKFLFFFLQSLSAKTYFDLVITGTTIFNLSLESIRNMPVTIPAPEEQQKITDYLEIQTAKIDNLIQETQTSIELLKEHRTALIRAAVTGKIDVREFAN